MLSIIVTVRDDQEEANATLKSIRDTCGDEVETIFIDDGSDQPLTLDYPVDVFRRVSGRCGVGGARHLGALLASRENLLVIDSHMRFESGWLPKALAKMKDRPKTVWSCTCVGLNKENMDMAKATKFYNGATILFYGKNANRPDEMQFVEPKWEPADRYKDGEEIPCVLGASYFMHRDFFFQIGGSNLLRGWGSWESHFSLKAYLAGGECRIMRDVRIGHCFRSATTFTTKKADLLFNKLAVAMTLFPEPASKFIVDRLTEYHASNPLDLNIAKNMMRAEQRHIESTRAFNEAVFVRDLEWYLEKFGQPRFWA